MLKGSVRLAAVDENGQSFIDDISAGDVWFFPAGVPHSIQALDEGCEFLLVFDDGSFSEDGTVHFWQASYFCESEGSSLEKPTNPSLGIRKSPLGSALHRPRHSSSSRYFQLINSQYHWLARRIPDKQVVNIPLVSAAAM